MTRFIDHDDYEVVDAPRRRAVYELDLEDRVSRNVLRSLVSLFASCVTLALGVLAFIATMRLLATIEIIAGRH